MRLFFRLTLFLLTLSCLTGMATLNPSDHGVASIQAKLSTISANLRVAQAEPNVAHGKLRTGKSNTAALEDGPEDEQIPLANLVLGYDGDDQIKEAFDLPLVRIASSSANTSRKSVQLSHQPCAGFPTGPPFA